MTRLEHLAWCKQRALAYVDSGNFREAIMSMMSDLDKHEGTSDAGYLCLLAFRIESVVGSASGCRKFIEGFN